MNVSNTGDSLNFNSSRCTCNMSWGSINPPSPCPVHSRPVAPVCTCHMHCCCGQCHHHVCAPQPYYQPYYPPYITWTSTTSNSVSPFTFTAGTTTATINATYTSGTPGPDEDPPDDAVGAKV